MLRYFVVESGCSHWNGILGSACRITTLNEVRSGCMYHNLLKLRTRNQDPENWRRKWRTDYLRGLMSLSRDSLINIHDGKHVVSAQHCILDCMAKVPLCLDLWLHTTFLHCMRQGWALWQSQSQDSSRKLMALWNRQRIGHHYWQQLSRTVWESSAGLVLAFSMKSQVWINTLEHLGTVNLHDLLLIPTKCLPLSCLGRWEVLGRATQHSVPAEVF